MYDQLSINYDRFVNWKSRLAYEMPFIRQLLSNIDEPRPLRILDAACGTGMHVIELARLGYAAAGADFSKPMVEKAIENAAALGVSARFETAGFGELAANFVASTSDRFDALLCLGNSIPHVTTQPELERTLCDFATCLRPGGLLLIQNRNFDAVMQERNRWMEPQTHKEAGEEWVFLRFYDFLEEAIQFNILTLHRKGDENWQQYIDSTRLFPWQKDHLTAALETAQFTSIKAFGDMTGAPFDAGNSGNLIVKAVSQPE